MGAFIKRHWVAYVAGIIIALLLGFGLSYVLGQKWSTPESVRAAREAKHEREHDGIVDEMSLGDFE